MRYTLAAILLLPLAALAQAPDSAVVGESVLLYQTRDENIRAATLFYRYTGGQPFMQQPLEYQSGQWSAMFHGQRLRPPGLEYYLSFQYKDGRSKTLPERYPSYNPLFLKVLPHRAIRIRLLDTALSANQEKLAFEVEGAGDDPLRVYLDEMDVTDFMRRDAEKWVLDNEAGLFSGSKTLSISSEQGEVLARQALDFRQQTPAPVQDRELVLRGNAGFSLGGRADATASDESSVSLSGNLHVESEYRNGDFKSSFSGVDVNYQYGADPSTHLSSGYLWTNTYRNYSLELGDVSVSGAPLVLSGFARRGMQAKTTGDDHSLSLFNVRTEPVEGWQSGISFDDRQTWGMTWQQQMGQKKKSSLTVSMISGKLQKPQTGNVRSSNANPQAGDSAGLQLTTQLGGTTIAAQLAGSRFDANTSDATDGLTDQAYELRLSRNIFGLASSLGFHRYGANYATIANPNFSNDRLGYDLSVGSQIQFLGWTASLSSTRDNVEDDITRPVVTSGNAGLKLDFIFDGWPTLNLGFNVSTQDSRDEPNAAQRVRTRGQDVSLGLSDTIGPVHLSWSSSLGRLQDKLDASKDSDTLNHVLSLGYSGEAARLNLNLSRNESRAQATQVADLVNLAADFPVFHEGVVFNSQLSWQHNSASDHSQDNRVTGGSARLSWRLGDMFSSVSSTWADAQFALNWSYNRSRDELNPGNDQSDQRIVLEFSLGAPVSFEHRWQF